MMNGDDPRGLDYSFRRRGLELIKAKISDFAKKTNNLIGFDTINAMASKTEAKINEKATSKQDYVCRMDRKLTKALSKSISGNRLGNFSAVHNRQFAQQNQMFVQQSQQFVQQSAQFAQQNVVQREIRNNLLAQPNRMVNVNGSFNEVGNGHAQYVTYQSSQPQYSGSVVSSSLAQRNQFHMTEMPSTTAMTPFSDPRNTNADQHKLIITQFYRVRSSYLPELHIWLNYMQAQLNQAITVSERGKRQRAVNFVKQMIRFLEFSEAELMVLDEPKIRRHINIVIDYYNKMIKRVNSSAVNQVQQFSSLQRLACPNVMQNAQTAPIPMNRPVISSSTINPGFSNSHSSAASSYAHGSVSTAEQKDMTNGMLHIGTQGFADFITQRIDPPTIQATQTAAQPLETPQSVHLPEKRKHPTDSTTNPTTNATSKMLESRQALTDSTSKPSTNATNRILKKPKTQSSGSSHNSWLNLATNRSKKRSKLCQSSPANSTQPSTPMTPSSVNSTVLDSPAGNNAQSETIREDSNSTPCMLKDLASFVDTPETLTGSPMVSECTGPESTTQQPSEKRPIDRLLDAVKSASKETLVGAADDMRSAIIDIDKLPEYASFDPSDVPTLDDDLKEFLESLNYDCMDDDEHQQQYSPSVKRKRDYESVSRDAFFSVSDHDCTLSNKPSSKSESNRALLDEITDTNQKLIWSVVKLVNDSSDQSDGFVVRVTYRPIALSADILRSMFACDSINLSVEFLVPLDYPSSPPKILGCKLPDFGIAIEMTELSKSLFDREVRSVDPLRVGKMAEVWDVCARSVFVAYAKRFGVEALISATHDQL